MWLASDCKHASNSMCELRWTSCRFFLVANCFTCTAKYGRLLSEWLTIYTAPRCTTPTLPIGLLPATTIILHRESLLWVWVRKGFQGSMRRLREVRTKPVRLGTRDMKERASSSKKTPSFCTNAHILCSREGNGNNGTGPNRKSNTNDFHLVNPSKILYKLIAMLTYMPGMFHCIVQQTAVYTAFCCMLQRQQWWVFNNITPVTWKYSVSYIIIRG